MTFQFYGGLSSNWPVLVGFCAAAALGLYAFRRYRRVQTKKGITGVMSALQRGEVVPVSIVVAELRKSPQDLVLDPETLAAIRACGTAAAKSVADQVEIMTRAMALLEVRRATAFDPNNKDDAERLKTLWASTFEPAVPFQAISEEWSKVGFQGSNPSTDLRGGGMLALDELCYFATHHTEDFKEMIAFSQDQHRNGDSWFFLAVVSIQFTVVTAMRREPPVGFTVQQLATLYCDKAVAPVEVCRRVLNAKNAGAPEYAGMFEIHSQLLCAFFAAWKKDLPFGMDYTQWVHKVYQEFFIALSAPPPRPKGLRRPPQRAAETVR